MLISTCTCKFVYSLFLLWQLRDPKIRKMADLLEVSNSSYFPVFKEIFRDVVEGMLIVLIIFDQVH